MAENKKPAIRFKGFTDAWEQRKLGECFDERTERSADGELIAVTINSGVVKASELNRHDNSSEDKSNYKVVRVNDIAYNSMRMWQGASGYSQYDGILSPAYTVVIPRENVNPVFFSYMFKRTDMIHEFQINSQGLTSDTWNLKFPAFSTISANVPKLEEQQAIGNYFTNLDHLITLHQRKYDKLVKVKKSMLEKMFPKNGSEVPEIRFKGFTDAWEQREAKNLFVSTADKGHPELPVLSATQDRGMIRRDENSINIYHDKKNEEGYKRVLPGQFVIHLRSFQGGFAHSAIEGITSPAYTVFGFSELEKHNPNFWKYVFTSKEFIRRLETVTYGIRDGRSISYDEFLTMDFVFPTQDEQTKIANYLDTLDRLITLHQRKLEKLKNIKKSCLEKMFV